MNLFLEDTKLEKSAIKSLERAFKKCSALGLQFSVMDNSLLYANTRLYEKCLEVESAYKKKYGIGAGVYPTIAYAQETEHNSCNVVNCYDSMDSCGGW
jgi:hypothetical protein